MELENGTEKNNSEKMNKSIAFTLAILYIFARQIPWSPRLLSTGFVSYFF